MEICGLICADLWGNQAKFIKQIYFLKKFLRILLKTLKILLIVVVSLYAIAYFYIRANKNKLIARITEQVGDKLNGKLTIGDADISIFRTFPKIAVEMNDVMLTDTMYRVHHHAFFSAKKIYANLNIYKLISKNQPLTGLRVDNGSIYLYTDTAGYTNTYLLKSKKDPAGGPKRTNAEINLKTLELNNTSIILDDRKKEKLHDFDVKSLFVKLDDKDHVLRMNADADLLVNSLAFNLPRGTFLKSASFKGNFDLSYGTETQLLSFDDIPVRLSGLPFRLTGKFDLGEKNPGFTLKLAAKKVMYDDVKKLLPKRIDSSLSIVTIDQPINADAELYGPLHGGEPYVLVRWQVEDVHITSPFMDFDKASFGGFYNNEVTKGLPRKDPNSVIVLNNFRAEWHGLPVNSDKIQILNLSVPELSCDMHSAFPLTSLNEIIPTESLQLTAGDAAMVLNYKGPIVKNSNTNSFLNGNITFKNGKVLYVPRNVEMKNVNGTIAFQNSNIAIQNLQCEVVNNKIVMNGTADNLLTLINTEPNRIIVNYSIFSPQLNLGSFMYLLKKSSVKKSSVKKSNRSFGDMAEKIDRLLQQSNINVNLRANRLLYKKFDATNAVANISLLQDRYVINGAGMTLPGGGTVNMNMQLLNNAQAYHTANMSAVVSNADVKKLFVAFEDFGQDAIGADNLEGQLSAKVNAAMFINDDGKVMPNSVTGLVDFSLKNGALNNFEPIKKIQNHIFRKRDFDNIRFAELKDKLEINRGDIKINRMEIQSSVLSLFVEGIYSRRGNTDISIQVPLSNLKKRSADFNPVNIGADKKGGRSIFLRGRPGSDGKIDFKVDLFNKFKKENK